MEYKDKVQLDYHGFINGSSLVSLTSNDWGKWIQDQLNGRGITVSVSKGRSGEPPSFLFLDEIPNLKSSDRVKAYRGIEQCLDRAYKIRTNSSAESDWGDIPLDDLLFLVGGVEDKYEEINSEWNFRHQDTYFAERSDKITRFLDVIEARPDVEENDVYAGVLQALNGTKSKLPYEFWVKALGKSPRYAALCFGGASNNSPYDGINLLPYIDWSDEEVKCVMKGNLPLFYQDYHKDKDVMEAIERKKQELSKSVQSLFDEVKKDVLFMEENRENILDNN
ncbi:MAG: hypothetical protein AABX84_00855 [Nanoarchaeota archaeon]